MKDTLRKLADLMDAREKVRAVGFAVGMVAVGVLEMAAVAAVPVFVSIMNDPGVTDSYAPLREAFRSVGAETPVRRLVWAGGVLGALYLLRTAASLLLVSRQATFAFDLQERVSRRLFDAYLGAPYTFHLKRNPAQLLDHLMMVPGLVQNILLNTMRLLMELLVFAGILALLVAVEPVATLVAAAVLGSASGVFVWAMRRKLNHLAGWEFEYRQRMVRTINSALCGIKEVMALERRGFFRDRFADQLAGHTRAGRFRSVVAEVPRPTLETLSILGMLTVTGLLLLQGRPIEAIVPSLTLVAVGALRIVPSLNRLTGIVTGIGWAVPALNAIHADLAELGAVPRRGAAPADAAPSDPRVSERTGTSAAETAAEPSRAAASSRETGSGVLELRNVSYRYPGTAADVVRNVTLRIPAGESVAFVGRSGAGKTTLIDVILGLLPPTAGAVLFDGRDIADDLEGWRRRIGYIPQSVYLSDDTIRQNIAFGVDPDAIDEDRLRRAVRQAQLEELIRDLPDGPDTVIGERGVRLSGGQRQRVGIARALYHDPAVLVMDEATSALDTETERLIVETFDRLRQDRTLIVIAHRMSTVRRCDRIYVMENGRLTAEGSYSRLLDESHAFGRLVRLGHDGR